MFKQQDLELFKEKGISQESINQQIKNFENGFPFADLISAATPAEGITFIDKEERSHLIEFYEKKIGDKKIVKFVPASGAASRMFKTLFSFKERYRGTDDDVDEFFNDTSFNSPYTFLKGVESMALFNDLKKALVNDGIDYNICLQEKDYGIILEYVLEAKGLNYASLPKGLLKFHKYDNYERTAMEEHLVEGAKYCKSEDNKVYIHFTISPDHWKKFELLLDEVQERYEKEFDVEYIITFSIQKPSTDIIAVDKNNKPFRELDGNLLFRPGGHGALIENLNEIEGDIIFIKNIDNVVPDGLKEKTIKYKKVIGGLLLKLQEQTEQYLTQLEFKKLDNLEKIKQFAEEKLNIKFSEVYENLSIEAKSDYLIKKLNRPIRICGMVKNEGEPGGGPFWVKNSKGETSLQIVEKSQIDTSNTAQHGILNSSTHFNPVDLVCATKDYKGNKFNLKEFIDHETGFISEKSKNGRELKAQELPGLWNGAMADWITLFVEVPLVTFNPVKTINDLLRDQHK